MKKCPKCKKYTMEETYGGLTGMIWYQTYECNKCNYNIEKNIKNWKHKFKNSNFHYWNFFIVSNFFGSSYNFIWSKNALCISTPDKFYFNNTFNFVFSLYYEI